MLGVDVVADWVLFVGTELGVESVRLQADKFDTARIREIIIKERINFFISISLYISLDLESLVEA